MKKEFKIIAIAGLGIIAVLGIVCLFFISNGYNAVKSFQLADYSEYISDYNAYFPEEKKIESVGPVDAADDAKKVAEEAWREIYGDSVTDNKPYKVRFDEEMEVWLVSGTVFFMDGGPHILIQKSDGKVLAVWYEKF